MVIGGVAANRTFNCVLETFRESSIQSSLRVGVNFLLEGRPAL
jgi:hypothetical protein